MKVADRPVALDQRLLRELGKFVPAEVFDAHAHLVMPAANLPAHLDGQRWGLNEYRRMVESWLPGKLTGALLFGFPSRDNDRGAINRWVGEEVGRAASAETVRGLVLTAPQDDRAQVEGLLKRGDFIGIKPYHVYAPMADTRQADIEAFTPEWMWDLCNAYDGVLMLHVMHDRAISHEGNLAALDRLTRRYPRCRLILAHIGRSFSYRMAPGLAKLAGRDNVWVDTSAVTERETFRQAIDLLGADRILFGTDFPISNLRCRVVATGEFFTWIHADKEPPGPGDNPGQMTLNGIESLLCLKEAAEDCALSTAEVAGIFGGNARRLLADRRPADRSAPSSGPARWAEAKTKISGGTGLRSKWAELYDPASWPSFYSRCQGSQVWDTDGRRYTDFGAGAGAIVLGYSDPDVNRAVRHRVSSGSYCQLVSPQESELAELLLELHPWAGKVRFARGGGDAMGVAVRIARAATGRSGVAFCGYHGWQDWYLAANLGDGHSLDGHLIPGLAPLGVPRELAGTAVPFEYNRWEAFEAALSKLEGRVAAVVMEPMRTRFPTDDFLGRIARRCREIGAVFILDEITSGWRFGFPGAHARLDIEPDIAVYAKAISNGFPCAAIVGRPAVMDAADGSFISSSYWTDGVGPAAGLASVRKMRKEKASDYVWALGEKMQRALEELAKRHPTCKGRSWGLPSNPYFTLDLGENALSARRLIVRKMLKHGFLSTGAASFIMLSHTEDDVRRYVEALDSVLGEIDPLIEQGRLGAEAGTGAAIGAFARLT